MSAATAGVVGFVWGLIPLGLLMLFYLDRVQPIMLVWIPFIAAVQYVFTLASAVLVSAANVFFRDLGNAIGHGLRLWWFLSPGLYSLEAVRETAVRPGRTRSSATLAGLNPFAVLFEAYRAVIYGDAGRGRAGPTRPTSSRSLILLAGSLVFLAVAVSSSSASSPSSPRSCEPRTRLRASTVNDLGVRYNLRFTRKTTLRGSFASLLPRRKPERFWALRHVSVQVNHGESLAVIGPNGAGKSTFLQVLAGIMRPTEGDGRRPRPGLRPARARASASTPSSPASRTSSSAARSWASTARASRELLPEIVEFADLGQFIDAPLKTYSSGMRARLGFSIATAVDPDILLLDEVLATGDASFRAKSKARVIELVKSAKAVVLVTHDMDWVREYCNRALLIEKGQVVLEGSPDEVTQLHLARTRGGRRAAQGGAQGEGPRPRDPAEQGRRSHQEGGGPKVPPAPPAGGTLVSPRAAQGAGVELARRRALERSGRR